MTRGKYCCGDPEHIDPETLDNEVLGLMWELDAGHDHPIRWVKDEEIHRELKRYSVIQVVESMERLAELNFTERIQTNEIWFNRLLLRP